MGMRTRAKKWRSGNEHKMATHKKVNCDQNDLEGEQSNAHDVESPTFRDTMER